MYRNLFVSISWKIQMKWRELQDVQRIRNGESQKSCANGYKDYQQNQNGSIGSVTHSNPVISTAFEAVAVCACAVRKCICPCKTRSGRDNLLLSHHSLKIFSVSQQVKHGRHTASIVCTFDWFLISWLFVVVVIFINIFRFISFGFDLLSLTIVNSRRRRANLAKLVTSFAIVADCCCVLFLLRYLVNKWNKSEHIFIRLFGIQLNPQIRV